MVKERLPAQVNIWPVLSSAIFTGRFTILAAIGAKIELAHINPFDPKPPPIKGEINLTFSLERPSMVAIAALFPYTDCVASYTINSSPFQTAAVAWGSMGL